MASPAPRSIFRTIIFHFFNSIKPKQITKKGTQVGTDHYGTIYYEAPISEHTGKTRPSRYYATTKERDDFEQEIPPEWMAWLRFRRKEPPTEEEVLRNYNAMLQVKANVAKLEEERLKEKQEALGSPGAVAVAKPEERETYNTFPVFKDYENYPGEQPGKAGKY